MQSSSFPPEMFDPVSPDFEEQWAAFHRRWDRFLRRQIRGCFADIPCLSSHVDDAVQMTWTRVFQKCHQYLGLGLSSWLARVAQSVARNYIRSYLNSTRSSSHSIEDYLQWEQSRSTDLTGSSDGYSHCCHLDLVHTIKGLQATDAELLMMSAHGYSEAEMRDALGFTGRAGLRTKLHRARQRLRERLSENATKRLSSSTSAVPICG